MIKSVLSVIIVLGVSLLLSSCATTPTGASDGPDYDYSSDAGLWATEWKTKLKCYV